MRYVASLVFILLGLVALADDSSSGCPMHDAHSQKPGSHSHEAMNERGDQVMGFSHEKTTHHFTLLQTGGQIQVNANNATDTESITNIRAHLKHIANAFSAGDFQMPHDIHRQQPPGAPVMRAKKEQIRYQFKETDEGALVLMESDDAEAISAIHDFLRFQIEEHQTGDPLEVE